jgi:hypothetical protein
MYHNFITTAEITPSRMEEILPTKYAYDLKESKVCLGSGAFRASVVMSGIALERNLQERYWDAFAGDRLKDAVKNVKPGVWIPTWQLLEILDKNSLITREERSLMDMLWTVRNSCAHPNDFYAQKEFASSIGSLVKSILLKYYAEKVRF